MDIPGGLITLDALRDLNQQHLEKTGDAEIARADEPDAISHAAVLPPSSVVP